MIFSFKKIYIQAARGFAQAGLGLRSCTSHAPAAFLASVGACLEGCAELDTAFSVAAVKASAAVVGAWQAWQTAAREDQPLSLEAALASTQWTLSQQVDAASWSAQLRSASLCAQAVLQSEAGVGARSFLCAAPSGRTRMEPAVFAAELRMRLGIPDAEDDCWCPRGDGVLDRWNFHAGMCVAGGERTQRHNAIRDLVFQWADRAGLWPEKEPASILLPQRPEDSHMARHRPADVYLPALGGAPAALDFAMTAPQRQETLATASREIGAAAAAYARHKESHLNIAQSCEAQGVVFVPMVMETIGIWDKGAAIVLQHITRVVASRTGEEPDVVHAALVQELCIVARSFRARAALRRRSEAVAD